MIIPLTKVAGSDTSNPEQWIEYIDTLNWSAGNRDQSAFSSFLRAGDLSIDQQKAMESVIQRITNNGGTYNANKLQSQLTRAYEFAGSSEGKTVTIIQPRTEKFNPDKLKTFADQAPGIDIEWLKTRSPVSLEEINSSAFLDHLYQPGEKVLVFTELHSQGEHLYEVGKDNTPLPKLTANGVWFLVNPVDGLSHPNPRQDNKASRRSEESVTSWRYLVLESDVAEQSQWLSCLVQLPLQISAIYSSGGKSIHALVRVDAQSKQHWDSDRDKIKLILVPLGADEAAMTGVRLSRLPCSMRGLRQQELLYLNPNPSFKPLIQQF